MAHVLIFLNATRGHLFINCGCVEHAFDVLQFFGESSTPDCFSLVRNASILRSCLDSSGWFKFEAWSTKLVNSIESVIYFTKFIIIILTLIFFIARRK